MTNRLSVGIPILSDDSILGWKRQTEINDIDKTASHPCIVGLDRKMLMKNLSWHFV